MEIKDKNLSDLCLDEYKLFCQEFSKIYTQIEENNDLTNDFKEHFFTNTRIFIENCELARNNESLKKEMELLKKQYEPYRKIKEEIRKQVEFEVFVKESNGEVPF